MEDDFIYIEMNIKDRDGELISPLKMLSFFCVNKWKRIIVLYSECLEKYF